MKKLLLILTALLAALSIQAQTLYVLGCAKGLSYEVDKAMKVEQTDKNFGFYVEDLCDLCVSLQADNPYDDCYMFRFGYLDLGKDVSPLHSTMWTSGLFSSLPFDGDYYVRVSRTVGGATFFGRLHDGILHDGTLYYSGESADGASKVWREFTRLSDSEFLLDCTGVNRIPAGQLFRIVGEDCEEGYGCGMLDGQDCVRLWQFGKFSILTRDFDGVLTVKLNPGRLQPMEVAMTETASVSDLFGSADNGSVRYYNLQGVEVTAPRNGIFVEQCGGTSRLVKK